MTSSADRLINLLHEARHRPAGSERERFLQRACQGDRALAEQVSSLIEAHEQAGDFLQPQAPSVNLGRGREAQGERIGPYRLGPVLGEGGCGVVYLADQEEPVRRQVALKVIKLGMDTRAVVARFDAERQALARMDHPSIARVFDAGATETGRPFFVMELVRGTRITDYCDQARLSVNQRLGLFIQVCQAVQHAHQKGIIHRDLKPSNVLVTVQDGAPLAKVIDFGIAKATADQRLTDLTVFTALEQFLGTPAYMSPEQAGVIGAGPGDIDTRSDIYSLGVLLYELLTGAPPFEARELMQGGPNGLRQCLRDREPPRPSARLARTRRALDPGALHRPRFESDLDWIVMKCLEKERARRYPTANALAADLERFLSHDAVVARPPSTAYRLSKAFRRNRTAFTAAIAVGFSLVMGLATSLWQTSQANRAREGALRDRQLAERQNYALRMASIRNQWQENDLERVRQILDQTARAPDRGFEWYYWQRQVHSEAHVLQGHLAPVMAVGFSPDGAHLVTASLDGTARVWDTRTGSETVTFRGHDGEVRAAAFSPDGSEIATAGADRLIRIWNIVTGGERLTIPGHHDTILSVAFSRDGHLIASGGLDRSARVWDAVTGESLASLAHTGQVWTVSFSREGRRLLTGCGDESAVVWDLSNRTPLLTIPAPSTRVEAWETGELSGTFPFTACFSPDGRHIVTGNRSQVVWFWHAETGRPDFRLASEPNWLSPLQWGIPFTLAFEPRGRWLVTGRLDHTIHLWSVDNTTQPLTFKGPMAEVACVAVSPDGQWVAAGGFDHTARIWAANRGTESLILDGHTKTVPTSAFSKDGTLAVTGSWDGTARIWNTSEGRLIQTLNHTNTELWAVSMSSDGRWVFTGGSDGIVRCWDAGTSPARVASTLLGHTGTVWSVVLMPGGQRLLTGAEDGTARVWDLATGKVLQVLQGDWPIVYAAVSPDGHLIVTTSSSPEAVAAGHRVPATNAERIAGAKPRWAVKVWDAHTGRFLFPLVGHLGAVDHPGFSPNGRWIVTCSFDGTARIWDATTGRQEQVLQGHSGRVVFAAFLPDGRRVVTAGFDNYAPKTRVWDAQTGQELLMVKDSIAVGVSPDGRRILVGGYPPHSLLTAASDNEVSQWQAEERAAKARLEAERRLQAEPSQDLRRDGLKDDAGNGTR